MCRIGNIGRSLFIIRNYQREIRITFLDKHKKILVYTLLLNDNYAFKIETEHYIRIYKSRELFHIFLKTLNIT